MVVSNVPARREAVQFGAFRLIASERLLLKESEAVALDGHALDILIALVERAGEVVSRRELIQRIWPDVTIDEANLRVHVASLRKALGDGQSGARYVANVPGRGYCFVAPVHRIDSGATPSGLAASSPSIRTLPAWPQRIVGRDAVIEQISSQIVSRRFVSIVGPGGIGKTIVAIAVAHRMKAHFGEAICFVDLGALDDGALVVSAVASATGCLGYSQGLLPGLLAFLADKQILLILDSCEHVLKAAAELTEQVLREAPLVRILATTRQALQIEGESTWPLQPLESPPEDAGITAATALRFPAVMLFMDCATASGYRDELTDESASAVGKICRQLDGNPLAIELTARHVGTYGISGLAERIGDSLTLRHESAWGVLRHRTLQAAHDWSYGLLSEHEKAVLCRLSVFAGDFTLTMARAVAGEPDRDIQWVADMISNLVDKSLVSVASLEGATRYRLLHATRSYAAAKLAERGEENAIKRRHARYFAEQLAPIRTNLLQERDLAAYTGQIGDITAALEWSFSAFGDATVGKALGAGAVPLFLGLSMLRECRRWCREILGVLKESERGTRLELSLQLSLAIASAYSHGSGEEVRVALERGLHLAEVFQDNDSQLHLLAGLNLLRARVADFGGALAVAKRYAAVARESGDSPAIVAGEWMLGASHHLMGNQALAEQSYEVGFERAAVVGVNRVYFFGYDHQVRAFIGRARTLWLRGRADEAARVANQGIEAAGRERHPVTLCVGLLYATHVFLWRGDQDIAEELIERLIAHASKYSLAPYYAGGLGLRGALLIAKGNLQPGIDALRSALSALKAENQHLLTSTFSRALAEGLARNGQPQEAAQLLDTVIVEARQRGGTFEMPDLLRAQAEVLLEASREDEPVARDLLMQSIECARQQAALGWELRSAIALIRLSEDEPSRGEALTILSNVYRRFMEGFGTADLREANRLLTAHAALNAGLGAS